MRMRDREKITNERAICFLAAGDQECKKDACLCASQVRRLLLLDEKISHSNVYFGFLTDK